MRHLEPGRMNITLIRIPSAGETLPAAGRRKSRNPQTTTTGALIGPGTTRPNASINTDKIGTTEAQILLKYTVHNLSGHPYPKRVATNTDNQGVCRRGGQNSPIDTTTPLLLPDHTSISHDGSIPDEEVVQESRTRIKSKPNDRRPAQRKEPAAAAPVTRSAPPPQPPHPPKARASRTVRADPAPRTSGCAGRAAGTRSPVCARGTPR